MFSELKSAQTELDHACIEFALTRSVLAHFGWFNVGLTEATSHLSVHTTNCYLPAAVGVLDKTMVFAKMWDCDNVRSVWAIEVELHSASICKHVVYLNHSIVFPFRMLILNKYPVAIMMLMGQLLF